MDSHMHTTLRAALRILGIACLVLVPLGAQQTTTPAPVQAPKQVPGYIIGANDVLQVSVYSGGQSQPEFRVATYTVQTDGSVTLPLIKPIRLAGLSVLSASAAIRQALITGRYFEECNVDITIMGYHSSHLKVQGAVNKPGNVDMTAERMNISDVLNAAGNLQPSAGTEIKVKRAGGRAPEPDVLVRDGWEIYSRDDLNNGKLTEVQLYDNDTVEVPVAPKFFVQGNVTTPGESQWEPNLTLERALIKVGGATKDGATNRIEIRRIDPKTKEYKKIKLAKDAMSTIIEAGDIIKVPKKRM